MITLYYTSYTSATNAAEDLSCCGYIVTTDFDGSIYTLTANPL